MSHYLYRDDNGIFRIGSLSNEFFIFTTGEGGSVVPVVCTGSPSSILSAAGSGWPQIFDCISYAKLGDGTGYVQWTTPEETGDCDIYYQLGTYDYYLMQPPPTGTYTQYDNGDFAVYIREETPGALSYNETYDYWWPGNIKSTSSFNNVNGNSISFSGLACGSRYSWAVRACNTSGCGPWTDITWNGTAGTAIGSFRRDNDPVTSVTVNSNYSTIDVDYSFSLCDNCVESGTPIAGTNPLISGFIYDYDTNELIATATAYQREATLMFSNPIPQGVSGLYYIEVTEDLYLYNGTSGNFICYNGRSSYCGRTLYYLEHI